MVLVPALLNCGGTRRYLTQQWRSSTSELCCVECVRDHPNISPLRRVVSLHVRSSVLQSIHGNVKSVLFLTHRTNINPFRVSLCWTKRSTEWIHSNPLRLCAFLSTNKSNIKREWKEGYFIYLNRETSTSICNMFYIYKHSKIHISRLITQSPSETMQMMAPSVHNFFCKTWDIDVIKYMLI